MLKSTKQNTAAILHHTVLLKQFSSRIHCVHVHLSNHIVRKLFYQGTALLEKGLIFQMQVLSKMNGLHVTVPYSVHSLAVIFFRPEKLTCYVSIKFLDTNRYEFSG